MAGDECCYEKRRCKRNDGGKAKKRTSRTSKDVRKEIYKKIANENKRSPLHSGEADEMGLDGGRSDLLLLVSSSKIPPPKKST